MDHLPHGRACPALERQVTMTPDDLIAAFQSIDDPGMAIHWTRVGNAETVRVVPEANPTSPRRFRAIATDAATIFALRGAGDPVERWLRFVLDHAPDLAESRHAAGAALYAVEDPGGPNERRVALDALTIRDAAAASVHVIRRCRQLAAIPRSPAPNLDPSTTNRPTRRPKRSEGDKYRDEGVISGYLKDHPDATRDEVARATGIAGGTVSGSEAWKTHRRFRKDAQRMNRARGIGGERESD